MHGGALGSGAPSGARNGAYQHGERSAERRVERRRLADLIRAMKAIPGIEHIALTTNALVDILLIYRH
jgi:hypothetical protein